MRRKACEPGAAGEGMEESWAWADDEAIATTRAHAPIGLIGIAESLLWNMVLDVGY